MNIDRQENSLPYSSFSRPNAADPYSHAERRHRGFGRLPNALRNHIIGMMGEFCGTWLFFFFAFAGTQVANEAAAANAVKDLPDLSALLYIALSFGFALAVNVWVFFRISGGLFNPAVTLGLCLIGAVSWVRGALVAIAQIAAGIAAAAVVSGLFPGPLAVRTRLGPGTSVVRGLFIEIFLTAMLILTIFMLAAEKHKGTFLAPVGIGLSLFITQLAGVFFTGGSLNPARSFGPDVVLGTFDGYHWIYWVGPSLGSLLAVTFYRVIKWLEYETANVGADFDGKEAEVFHPDEDPATAADVRRPNVGIGEIRPGRHDGTDELGYESTPQHSEARRPEVLRHPRGSAAASRSDNTVMRNEYPIPNYEHGDVTPIQDHAVYPSHPAAYSDIESGALRDGYGDRF